MISLNPEMAACDVMEEYHKARKTHPPGHSLHEAYAVLLEEVDELWEIVKERRHDYNSDLGLDQRARVRKEAMQIAAMALAIMVEQT